jgi:hypothetical protein
MPGVLTRSPESGFEVGPDPAAGLGVLESFERLFVLVQDATFALALLAILLGSVAYFSTYRTRSPRALVHGMYLTAFLFVFGTFLNALSWILTGSTRFDESLGLITDSIVFPASLLRRSITPPGLVPNPPATSSYPVHVLGRLFSLEVLFFSFMGLMGLTLGLVIMFTREDERGQQWFRAGAFVTTASFMLHTLLATVAWLATGSTGFGSAQIMSPSYTNTSTSTVQLPKHQLVNTDLIYPLVPTTGDIWPVIQALERSLQLSVTTAGWIGVTAVIAGAAIYFGTQRQSDRGQQWMAGGLILIVVMIALPLIVSTGTWAISGETQAYTEFGGGALTAGSTFESQTAEGWTTPDGAPTVVATNKTRNTFGIHIVGTAHHQYDVENTIDSNQQVTVVVARGQADVTISVDGRVEASRSDVYGEREFEIPDGQTVTVTVDGLDVVVEEVVIEKAPTP